MEIIIGKLLSYGKVLTIHRLEDGLMISLAETSEVNQQLIYIPEDVMLSTASLEDAMNKFHEHHLMEQYSGFDA